MSDDDSLFASVSVIAARIVELNKLGTDQYRPIVDDLIRSRCRDKQQIERTLDRLLDLCDYAPAVELFRRLCRHYFFLDPEATVYYVHSYREMWDSEDAEDTHAPSSSAK